MGRFAFFLWLICGLFTIGYLDIANTGWFIALPAPDNLSVLIMYLLIWPYALGSFVLSGITADPRSTWVTVFVIAMMAISAPVTFGDEKKRKDV